MYDKIFKKLLKIYRQYRNKIQDEKAGFKAISQREAFLLEDKITIEEKKLYCSRKAYAQLKYYPNLDNPESFNEKIIWLALNYKNEKVTKYSDKYEMKKYVSQMIGDKYVVPNIGIYGNVNNIDFDNLPNSFVMKSTVGWGSKQVIIAKEKNRLNLDKIKSYAAEWLYPWNNYYYNNLCITEEKGKPRIIIEDYIDIQEDYKIFCFNGIPKLMLIVKNRGTKQFSKTFIDLETWQPLPIHRNGLNNNIQVEKPDNLEELIELSKKLTEGFPIVRVDFYIYKGNVYVGEMTFYPGMFLKINPREWDYKMGKLIDISDLKEDV